MISKVNDIFFLNTANTTYAFCVYQGYIIHLYYGKKIEPCDITYLLDRHTYGFCPQAEGENVYPGVLPAEYPYKGVNDYRLCAIDLVSENALGCDLRYNKYKILKGSVRPEGLPYSREYSDCQTLIITLKDNEVGVAVNLYYTAFHDTDVIARHAEIINEGSHDIELLKALSAVFNFPPRQDGLDLLTLCGNIGNEHLAERAPLRRGVQGVYSRKGFTSHSSNPFLCLCDHSATEQYGDAYGFNLMYSGSFCSLAEVDDTGKTRVTVGINSEDFRYQLCPGEKFYTPQVIFTYSAQGLGGMSRNFHRHILKGIVPKRYAYGVRPVVINTWEPYGFDVNEEKVLKLADEAKKLGIDTVVLDDGWFRSRDNEKLGDWQIDKNKFPNGLKYICDEIHNKGMKFGLWIEPEMVNPDSDLFRKNPNCALMNRQKTFLSRNQLVLDLTKKEVAEDIKKKTDNLLSYVRPDYVKWDANRYLPDATGKDYAYTLAMYDLWEYFTQQYPEILFESCAGGGGRVDLGMLYYSTQIWISDNTDPIYRKQIQHSLSFAYPASSMSNHVTNMSVGIESSLSYRYLVSSLGTLGYENDIFQLNEKQKQEIIKLNSDYNDVRKIILSGDLYRLTNNDKYAAYLYVSEDKKDAVFTLLLLKAAQNMEFAAVKLVGLDRDAEYEISGWNQTLKGEVLMNAGLIISELNCNHSSNIGTNVLSSQFKLSGGGTQFLLKALTDKKEAL